MTWVLLLLLMQPAGTPCPSHTLEVARNPADTTTSVAVVCKSMRGRPFLFPTKADCEKAGKDAESFFKFIGRHADYSCESMEVDLS